MGLKPIRFQFLVKENFGEVVPKVRLRAKDFVEYHFLRKVVREGVSNIFRVRVGDQSHAKLNRHFADHNRRSLPSQLFIFGLSLHLNQVSVSVCHYQVGHGMSGMIQLLAYQSRLFMDLRSHFIGVQVLRGASICGRVLRDPPLLYQVEPSRGTKSHRWQALHVREGRLLIRHFSVCVGGALPRAKLERIRCLHVIVMGERDGLQVSRNGPFRLVSSVPRLHLVQFRGLSAYQGVGRRILR